MGVYIVSYDLRKKRDYPELYEALEAYDAVPILESVWAIDAQTTAKAIRNELQKAIDSDDGLFVIRVTKFWAGQKVENSKWLNSDSRSW